MKSIIKKASIALFVFTISAGCVDLNEDSPTLIKPKSFYTTVSDFEAALAGVYSPLYSEWESFDYLMPFLTAGAEDVKTVADAFLSIDKLQATDGEVAILQIWTKLYQSIANANTIIGNLSNAQGISDKKLGEIEGQAKFARAFAFFYLVRWFGEVQLTTFENQEQIETLRQATVPEIYVSIVSNLQDAAAKLPPEFPEERGRPTKWAAKSLLAKVYLTMAGWPIEDASNYAKARDEAKEVIDSEIFELEPNFADLWVQENRLTNKEFIFGFYGSLAEGGKFGSHMDLASRPVADGGWGDYFSEARFFNAFPDNARKSATFTTVFENEKTWQEVFPNEPFMAKYRDAGESVDTNSEGFFVVLRYADVLLMFAEAANMAEGGPSAAAYDAINQVRRRAIKEKDADPTPAELEAADLPSGLSQADFDMAVIAERNWELAFEGNRWFDLVRKQMVVEVNKDVYNNVTANNRLLPKPGQELIPGYLEQNPGY